MVKKFLILLLIPSLAFAGLSGPSSGGGGGGGTWGSITGTLSSQSDLNTALSGLMTAVTPGTSGNTLTSNGSAWTSATPSGGAAEYSVGSISGATTINISNGVNQRALLTGNPTVTFSGATKGQSGLLQFQQDGTGSRIITWANAKFNGLPPILTTYPNRIDRFHWYYNGQDYQLIPFLNYYDSAVSGSVWTLTKSVTLDGTTKYFTVPNGVPAFQYTRYTPFSMSVWYMVTSTSTAWAPIFSTGPFNLLVTSGTFAVQVEVINAAGSSAQLYGGNNYGFTVNTWHHILWTYDGRGNAFGVNVYMDGQPIGNEASNAFPSGNLYAPVQPKIGVGIPSVSYGSGAYFPGKLKDLSVWSIPLDAFDAIQIYNNGTPTDVTTHPKHAALVSYWRFGDTSGDGPTTVYDVVGGNNLTGANLVSGDFTSSVP